MSAITDLEKDRDFVDFGKENKPFELVTSPPQKMSPSPAPVSFTPTKQVRVRSQALYLLIVI